MDPLENFTLKCLILFIIRDSDRTSPSESLLAEANEQSLYNRRRGWSGGAMVLGKLPVPGRPTNLD